MNPVDTDPDVARRYREMLLALTPGERIEMACRMFDSARAIVLATIPDSAERRVELFRRFYGADFDAESRTRIEDALRRRDKEWPHGRDH